MENKEIQKYNAVLTKPLSYYVGRATPPPSPSGEWTLATEPTTTPSPKSGRTPVITIPPSPATTPRPVATPTPEPKSGRTPAVTTPPSPATTQRPVATPKPIPQPQRTILTQPIYLPTPILEPAPSVGGGFGGGFLDEPIQLEGEGGGEEIKEPLEKKNWLPIILIILAIIILTQLGKK